ncbi:hypothetical protein [Chromobacterium violaceum]|nr:hypothetical protein [Chromobacterium violaceum]
MDIIRAQESWTILVLIDNPKELHYSDFSIDEELRDRIRIVRYNGNIGLSSNLLNSIALADREWVWICGDDDDYKRFPVEDIAGITQSSEADMIKLSYETIYSDRVGIRKFEAEQKTLSMLMKNMPHSDFDVGELIFTSNMLLRVKTFSGSLCEGYRWCKTLLAHFAVILHSNTKKPVLIEFSPILAIGNNRYGDISWGRIDLYKDLVEISNARGLMGQNIKDEAKNFCRSYITTVKLCVQLTKLVGRNSSYAVQFRTLSDIINISCKTLKFHLVLLCVLLMPLPLSKFGPLAIKILQNLSGLDARFGRYANLIERESND